MHTGIDCIILYSKKLGVTLKMYNIHKNIGDSYDVDCQRCLTTLDDSREILLRSLCNSGHKPSCNSILNRCPICTRILEAQFQKYLLPTLPYGSNYIPLPPLWFLASRMSVNK